MKTKFIYCIDKINTYCKNYLKYTWKNFKFGSLVLSLIVIGLVVINPLWNNSVDSETIIDSLSPSSNLHLAAMVYMIIAIIGALSSIILPIIADLLIKLTCDPVTIDIECESFVLSQVINDDEVTELIFMELKNED